MALANPNTEELYVPTLDKPIPGESLTRDAESPAPFEGQPEITNLSDGPIRLLLLVTDEETYPKLMDSIAGGEVPLSEVAQLILFEGFAGGKWNPDMLILLFEPTVYMLMALAEKAQIEYKLYPGEEKDEEILDDQENISMLETLVEIARKNIGKKGTKVTSLPSEIQERIEEFKGEPIVEKEEEEEIEQSLMARPEEEELPEEEEEEELPEEEEEEELSLLAKK